MDRVVIVGGGHAAAQAIDTLRRTGFTGNIALVADEAIEPYHRPPLSKQYLAGELEISRLFIRPTSYYAAQSVEMYLGRRAVEIDRVAQRVRLSDAQTLAYDALLLCTGSRARLLNAPGAGLVGVHYLRSIGDVERLKAELPRLQRVVVIGGGYIGLETAATCRALGLDVTILEAAERVMNRVTCPELSSFYEAAHSRRGATIVCNARVRSIEKRRDADIAEAVLCDDGSVYPADAVIVGVGGVPNQEIAVAAGLQCDNGIVVDEYCRSSDAHIFAAGDCTNHPSLRYGRRLRLESVDNAFEQAITAALNMLGRPTIHDKVPWFWSDQYDLKLTIVGLCGGHDSVVVRGTLGSDRFSVCYIKGGELIAIDSINNPRDQISARKLIAARARPHIDRLADVNTSLKDTV